MHFVYTLESIVAPEHFYFGATSDLNACLGDHNAGRSWNILFLRP